MRVIDIEYGDGRTPDPSSADQHSSKPLGMASPRLPTGIEQPKDVISQRIESTKIRAFVEIAAEAAPSEIIRMITAAMLFGDDVFDVKRRGCA